MTTERDYGGGQAPAMLRCEQRGSRLYRSLELALRDMRRANGRDLDTGAGDGNESWIGLSLGMVVLDTLSGDSRGNVGRRWVDLLTTHGLLREDAEIIYKLRCSLLHGYAPPKPRDIGGRTMLLTPDPAAYALDTSQKGMARLSVPVFCGRLVERITAESPEDWDVSLINTDYPY